MSARGRRPRSALPATRSQNPAPKAAPANTAYAVIPRKRTTATASTTDRLRCAFLGKLARTVRHFAVVERVLAPEATAQVAQHEDRGGPEADVQQHDRDERDPHAFVPGRALGHLHVVVHDPRLATHLGHDPT